MRIWVLVYMLKCGNEYGTENVFFLFFFFSTSSNMSVSVSVSVSVCSSVHVASQCVCLCVCVQLKTPADTAATRGADLLGGLRVRLSEGGTPRPPPRPGVHREGGRGTAWVAAAPQPSITRQYCSITCVYQRAGTTPSRAPRAMAASASYSRPGKDGKEGRDCARLCAMAWICSCDGPPSRGAGGSCAATSASDGPPCPVPPPAPDTCGSAGSGWAMARVCGRASTCSAGR